MSDPFNLQRFLEAQKDCYSNVLEELGSGKKTSHWMWFIFPQIAGLGRSQTAVRFAVSGLDEARAYCKHPVLGKRLTECCHILIGLEGVSVEAVFGPTDSAKLRSSLTLFDLVSQDEVYGDLLLKYFEGRADRATIELIGTTS